MKVTLGGDRLGSGNKNKIALHNYERSTHNLTQDWTSSMQCGTLYPFLVLPAMRGDKFVIDLSADCRTIPTKAPLFGSFKMQVDVFQCDVRLYQAILHNNPLAIGLKMGQVKFPTLQVQDGGTTQPFSNSSLLKYLGMSGLGHQVVPQSTTTTRAINAIPALAYYEIFKTYYSNKQENNAYIISTFTNEYDTAEIDLKILLDGTISNDGWGDCIDVSTNDNIYMNLNKKQTEKIPKFESHINLDLTYTSNAEINITKKLTLKEAINYGYAKKINSSKINGYECYRILTENPESAFFYKLNELTINSEDYTIDEQGLQPFALANIDDMRLKLLSHHALGQDFQIINAEPAEGVTRAWGTTDGTDQTGLPYTALVGKIPNDYTDVSMRGQSKNCTNMNGLCVKTYQSDMFNNWVNTEWIDGENGISAITAISTASGSIAIDSLNLSEKLYNMLNRIAVSDGSYEGWQDAVYTETPKRHIESPIYLGGMSSEIVFEEITQTSPAEGQPLGTLAGKGRLLKRKGGHIVVKCNEAAFIIGIVSLTPRINYTQGNEFYMTDLMSMDDFHKPALDGIGFQNLIAERAAWWDTAIASNAVVNRHTLGKLPAWIEYMTAVNKVYGDFADEEGGAIMSLIRRYDVGANNTIADATTYIDPRKYNYAFANVALDAQNFWVQIHSDIKARRLMSAKQIPNI